jgi:transposase-like protein
MKIADAKISMPRAAHETNRSRRSYAQQFKREVVAQCQVPGASVSAIALSHGINANVIRKWLPRPQPGTSTSLAAMLPVRVEAATPAITPKPEMDRTVAAERAPIELSLAGATVRLPAGFNPVELRSIVQILAALR